MNNKAPKALESRQAQSERDSASGNDIAIAGNGNEGDLPSSALTDFSKRALEQACNDRTQPDAKKRTRRDYTDEEIECGLVAVAAANGNAARAAEVLAAEDGLEIPQRMLSRWSRKQHLERYQRVRSEVLPKIRAEVADEYVALTRKQIGVSRKLTDEVETKLGEPEDRSRVRHVRELANATKDLGLSAAIATDKAQILDHEPTVIVQRDFSEIKRALIAKGAKFVDVDSEEIPDALALEPGGLADRFTGVDS